MKTLDDFNFFDKTVLVRSDLNSEVVNGNVSFSERIRAAAETIRELKKMGAKVVMLAHQGRPGEKDFISLKQHAKHLNKKVSIKFVHDIIGKRAQYAIQNLKQGEAILLENVRYENDEFHIEKRKNNLFIKKLLPYFDFFVNDAFSVSHRSQASVVLFAQYLPSCVGRLLEQELTAIKQIHLQKSLLILGGVKPEENIQLLHGNTILSGGFFCHLCLIARGVDLGKQEEYLRREIKNYASIIRSIKKDGYHIETPIDFAILEKNKRKEINIAELPTKERIFDIGTKTIGRYCYEIKKAHSIFFKGPIGLYTDKRFLVGTQKILQAIADSKAFSIIAGGHSNEAIKKCGVSREKFNYVSLSGGALIDYLAGEKMPGLIALEKIKVNVKN
ncbi:MAG: phosphoglycerate kinase [Nanoarchaeota archaeon]|mgnify:CR=1 FL=1